VGAMINFLNEERAYLSWVTLHRQGFVLDVAKVWWRATDLCAAMENSRPGKLFCRPRPP